MDIHTAAHYMKAGYRVRRVAWRQRFHNNWVDQFYVLGFYFHIEDLLANDWEIVFDGIINDQGAVVQYEPERDEEEE